MKKPRWLFVIVLCCSLLPLWGWQEMPEYGAPKEMKKLDFMLGAWTGEFSLRQGPDQPWESIRMSIKAENVLDGCAQVQHWSGSMMGREFNGRATFTFNRQTGKWQSSWVDNMEGRQLIHTGGFEGDKLVFRGDNQYQGMSYTTRDTTVKVSDDEFHWMMEMSEDGGQTWFESMKATFKRDESP